jgi:hypothetical protein
VKPNYLAGRRCLLLQLAQCDLLRMSIFRIFAPFSPCDSSNQLSFSFPCPDMSKFPSTQAVAPLTARKPFNHVELSLSGSRRSSLALSDNFESPTRSPTVGSRRNSLSLNDNFELSSSPMGSRNASMAEYRHSDESPNVSDERHLMNLAVAAHEEQKAKKKQAQLDAVKNLKSNLLRTLITSAVNGSMSNWSKAAKKAFLLSQVDPQLTRAFIERSQLKVMFLLAIMNVACIVLQCTSSRVLENSRDAEVARQQVENLVRCCKRFNTTLVNGKCGAVKSEASTTCVVDASLIVSTDTDFAVAYGTDAFWLSFYLNSAVSALSLFSVIGLFYHAHLSRKLLAFSKHLETKSVGISNTETHLSFSLVLTPTFWFQVILVLIHMPPLPFDIPVLQFEHPYYTESKLLKYPWISLISAFVTLSWPPFPIQSPSTTMSLHYLTLFSGVYFVLIYIRDRTIIEWSSKRRIVERKTGVNVDAIFVLKVLMSEAPMTVRLSCDRFDYQSTAVAHEILGCLCCLYHCFWYSYLLDARCGAEQRMASHL